MANKKNYNKISTEKAAEETVEVVETVEEAVEETAAEPNIEYGKIANCTKLNIRNKPKKDANVVTVIDGKANIEIYPDESTKDWYKVVVGNGVTGYCMKKFVELCK